MPKIPGCRTDSEKFSSMHPTSLPRLLFPTMQCARTVRGSAAGPVKTWSFTLHSDELMWPLQLLISSVKPTFIFQKELYQPAVNFQRATDQFIGSFSPRDDDGGWPVDRLRIPAARPAGPGQRLPQAALHISENVGANFQTGVIWINWPHIVDLNGYFYASKNIKT